MSQERKTAVVTGASSGIGRAVAEQLAARGLDVVLVVRDGRQGAEVARAINAAGGAARVVVGDLTTVASTRELARDLLDACPRLDILVQVAGIWPSRRELTADGLERAFAVNHVSRLVLALLLEPRLVASRARVVDVSAGLHVRGRVDLGRTPTGEDFHAVRTYATTKLCSLLLMPLLAERWKRAGVTITALHPGVIRTRLGDRAGVLGVLLRLSKRLWKSPADGARPVVRLATEPGLQGVTGTYYHLDQETPLSAVARDRQTAQALWDQALDFAGIVLAPLEGDDRAVSAAATATTQATTR